MIRSDPAASLSLLLRSSRLSRAMPITLGMPPQAATDAAALKLLLSKIFPGSRDWPLGTSSSPVDRMATTGRRTTLTLCNPNDAMTPMTEGRMTMPGVRTCWPVCTSSPAGRTLPPSGRLERMSIRSLGRPSRRRATSSVSSKGTTVSAPSGTGAPVMMRIVVPGTTVWVETWPAATMPITFRLLGESGDAP